MPVTGPNEKNGIRKPAFSRLRPKSNKQTAPRHAQTGHTWHQSALSHLFSDHPKQSYAGHAKRAQKANSCIRPRRKRGK